MYLLYMVRKLQDQSRSETASDPDQWASKHFRNTGYGTSLKYFWYYINITAKNEDLGITWVLYIKQMHT